MRRLGLIALAAALLCAPAFAADDPKAEGGGHSDKTPAEKAAEAATATAPVVEAKSVTHHSVTIDGKAIAYTATAGTLTLRDEDGKPTASMFYVAYTADGPRTAARPVTFLYNGGPGSSSYWLHMGSFGPVRVRTASPDSTAAAPYDFGSSNESLLDKTDLVFLDAIGAGFSRPLGAAKGKDFWGVDQDVDAFARGIIRYITLNNRWNSPKFLFGESYGTPRSAALVNELQQRNVQFNGVMLLSSILNYGIRDDGFDQIYVTYLPSYAAAAWYHNKLANKPADLPAFLQQVRDWARGPYLAALQKGSDLTPAEVDAVAQQMSAYTGLSVQFIKEADLRVNLGRFRKELLRDERRTIGRYDSRFEGIDLDAAGETPGFDAAGSYNGGPYMGAFQSYLATDLDYHTDLTYRPSNDEIGRAWDWHHKPPGAQRPSTTPDTALDLANAMRENPHLKVFSLNGYYDMATPFFGTEYDIGHMQLDPTLRKNVRFAYYPSGHMVYLNPDALKTMKADVARFYDDAVGH
jgi:carboxypeptidase C (cathepsin A)